MFHGLFYNIELVLFHVLIDVFAFEFHLFMFNNFFFRFTYCLILFLIFCYCFQIHICGFFYSFYVDFIIFNDLFSF